MPREAARRRPILSARAGSRRWALALAVAALIANAARSQEAPAPTLPTPYSSEQIRDAWPEGFTVVLRTRDAQGERLERNTVVAWSAEGMTLRVQGVDASGQATGEPREASATWEQLRQHALFPQSSATRERAHRDTAIGSLDGWLYRVNGADGVVSEFFFADTTPGMPVQFGERHGEVWTSQSEQISRGSAAAKAP